MSKSIPELYGSLVFNDSEMKARLPKDVYKALTKTINSGSHLELDIANSVAVAMKEWALEHGATHFTHWFQPMTGITAETHGAGRRQPPVRRLTRHLRSPRIDRMGSYLFRIHQGTYTLYPNCLLFLQRRGTR